MNKYLLHFISTNAAAFDYYIELELFNLKEINFAFYSLRSIR